jgi:hypothetical protein
MISKMQYYKFVVILIPIQHTFINLNYLFDREEWLFIMKQDNQIEVIHLMEHIMMVVNIYVYLDEVIY